MATRMSRKAEWSWPRVLYELRLQGLSVSEVARRAGLKGTGAARVATRRWPRMEAAIARHLGVPPSVIWPERYRPDGLSATQVDEMFILASRIEA